VAISGSLDEIVELGWLHAKMYNAHKNEKEKELKNWIRNDAAPAND
jgi:hypothetical protein